MLHDLRAAAGAQAPGSGAELGGRASCGLRACGTALVGEGRGASALAGGGSVQADDSVPRSTGAEGGASSVQGALSERRARARGGCRDRRRHGAGSTAPALLLLALLLLARLVLVLCCGALQLLLLCGGALRRRTALIVVAGLTGRMAAVRAVRLAAHADGFATLTLTRGERHNALSDAVIGVMRAELAAVRRLAPRALFVRAEGKSFSAGADLEWMKRAAGYSRAENTADALELSGMLNDLATLPMPTVALVQGQALGGGVGLVAAQPGRF